jgi:predicted nucleic acid-binding protein
VTRFVIDPPTLVQLAGDTRSAHPDHQLVAPNSVRSRALGLLLDGVRAGELTERDALELHVRLTEVRMRLLGDRVSRRTAWNLAREHDWDTVDDAEYLAVAMLQADAIVTVDPALMAKASGVVPLARYTDLFVPDPGHT